MAGKVLPKLSIFLFLSIICMLVNISVCLIVLADTGTSNNDYFFSTNDYNYQGNIEDEGTNVTAFNFATGITTSFIPFVSIISISFLGLDATSFTIATIIIGIIGALQTLMLVLIGLCFMPNVLGSGVEV